MAEKLPKKFRFTGDNEVFLTSEDGEWYESSLDTNLGFALDQANFLYSIGVLEPVQPAAGDIESAAQTVLRKTGKSYYYYPQMLIDLGLGQQFLDAIDKYLEEKKS